MTDLTDIHDELRAVARQVLATGPADWSHLAEMGWLGLEVPEDEGGAGATFAEVAVVVEELARALTTSPYLGTVVLGAYALTLAEPTPVRDDLLAGIAAGTTRVALALPGSDDATEALPGSDEATEALPGGDDAETRPGDGGAGSRLPFRLDGAGLHGRAEFVPDAGGADHMLFPAMADREPVLVSVPRGAAGLTIEAQPVLDASRELARVKADRVEVGEVWPLKADGRERLQQRAALAVAVDSLGVAGAMLAATVAYAGVRVQFGRPIGSFQAVKHACADMAVQLAASRALVEAAIARPDATSVAMAKAHTGGMAVDVVGKALQLHGGIGYTWESGVPAYLKRAMANRSLFGSPRAHRARLAARYRADNV